MIIVDTNVVSEPSRPNPDRKVIQWLEAQDTANLYLTVTSLTELKVGIAVLPEGKRKMAMETQLAVIVLQKFGNKILEVTKDIAVAHAEIAASARKAGFAIGFADGQIAAIARAHGFAVATRDVEPFEAAGVDVINPWSDTSLPSL